MATMTRLFQKIAANRMVGVHSQETVRSIQPISIKRRPADVAKTHDRRGVRLSCRAVAAQEGPESPFEGMNATSKSADDMPEAQKSSEEMTVESVDRALDEVRPYLIQDGGNVEVVSVVNGAVALRLSGACGDCPSSTTTMKMGLERRLREVFGDAVTDVYQVQLVQPESTIDTVNTHLDFLRPAISNYGGSVEVLKVEDGVCEIKYEGPEVIWEGVSTSITDRFPEVNEVRRIGAEEA